MSKGSEVLFERLTELFKIRNVLTLTAWLVFLNMVAVGMIAADVLVGVVNILLGFWFGEKVAKHKAKAEAKV